MSFYLILILSLHSVWGSVGREQTPTLTTSICKLEIDGGAGPTICSGHLVGKNILKTAAHCLDRQTSISVTCPHQAQKTLGKEALIVTHPDFSIESDEFRSGERDFDLALIYLDFEVEQESFAQVPQSKEESQEIIKNAEHCFVAGYGASEKHLDLGHYKESLAPAEGLGFVGETLVNHAYYNYSVMPGDSGGSLLCLVDSIVFDLGTVSGKDFFNVSLFSPSHGIFYFSDFQNSKQKQSLRPPQPDPSVQIELGKKYRLKPFSLIYFQLGFFRSVVDNNFVSFTPSAQYENYIYGKFKNSAAPSFYTCDPEILCSLSGEGAVKATDLIPFENHFGI